MIMKFNASEVRPKFNPSKQTQTQAKQWVVPDQEAVRRITEANLHTDLKWLRNKRDKFERLIENKHDFLIAQANAGSDVNYLAPLDAELRNLYTKLEEMNVNIHNLQLQITGKKP